MKKPKMFRRRYIPNEIVDISNDNLLFRDEELLVTEWKPIKPRNDISRGVSYTYLNEGLKVSRFYDGKGNFAFWYCDIIEVEYDKENDTYTFNDLLVDIKVQPDGSPSILDISELAEALENDLITKEQAGDALKKMDKLLKMIYEGEFPPEACTT
jgi:predicted RNA-binding protein associated with RNAse of E/G family